jgi:hypothetical protein
MRKFADSFKILWVSLSLIISGCSTTTCTDLTQYHPYGQDTNYQLEMNHDERTYRVGEEVWCS